jgi:D-alanine-D-alanine ligase-like ATP-grasp enzyme
MGVHIVKTFPELISAIEDGVNHKKSILIEELISGKNATMHTVSSFRDQDIYAFPPGGSTSLEKEKLIDLAKNLHEHLGISHYLKSEFTINNKKKIYLTDIRFNPDLKQDSHFNKSCESVGTKTHNILEHILDLAFNENI